MIVAIDNTFLTLMLNPGALPRNNPATGLPVPYCRQRIEALIDRLTKDLDHVIVPAPSLAEVLVVAPDVAKVAAEVLASKVLDIVPFDARAAIELAEMTRKAKAAGTLKVPGQEWQHVKLDRQIVAIAKAHQATTFLTDDDAQSNFAMEAGLVVRHTWNLDLPPEYAQIPMDYGNDQN